MMVEIVWSIFLWFFIVGLVLLFLKGANPTRGENE